jgi:hypothetical protein
MIWSGAGPVSNVTIKDNQIRDSKRANLAVVVSGKTSGITLEGNQIDGEIAKRNGGSFNGNNTTNDSRMASSAPVPAGMPQLSPGDGLPPGPDIADTPPALPPSPTPDLTPRGSSAPDWTPNTVLPAIEAMRRVITSTTRPPNC